MMLDHLNAPVAAERIRAAVRRVLSRPAPRTPDLGGDAPRPMSAAPFARHFSRGPQIMSQVAGHCLDARVLVLNKFYMAVHVISVRRAFCLLFKDLAEVITIDDGRHMSFNFASWREVSEARALYRHPDDDFIRTVHFEIQVPRIIRLVSYDRLPRQRVKFNRRNLFARDGNRCQYCGKKFATAGSASITSLPRSRGGLATWDNIVCACLRCNVKKGGAHRRKPA